MPSLVLSADFTLYLTNPCVRACQGGPMASPAKAPPSEAGFGGPGFGTLSLKRFLDMCQVCACDCACACARARARNRTRMRTPVRACACICDRSRDCSKCARYLALASPPPASLALLSVKRVVYACARQDAELIGSKLSRNAIKMAFVNSLQFAAESAAVRKPLLSRGMEFEEALIRLAWAYDAPSGGGGGGISGSDGLQAPIGVPKAGRKQNRFSTLSAASAAAASISATVAPQHPLTTFPHLLDSISLSQTTYFQASHLLTACLFRLPQRSRLAATRALGTHPIPRLLRLRRRSWPGCHSSLASSSPFLATRLASTTLDGVVQTSGITKEAPVSRCFHKGVGGGQTHAPQQVLAARMSSHMCDVPTE